MTDRTEKIKTIMLQVMNSDIDIKNFVGENVINELGVTSVDALEILINMESEFNILIDDDDLSHELVDSVTNLSRYIENKQLQKKAV